jgi:hypothetical protein
MVFGPEADELSRLVLKRTVTFAAVGVVATREKNAWEDVSAGKEKKRHGHREREREVPLNSGSSKHGNPMRV